MFQKKRTSRKKTMYIQAQTCIRVCSWLRKRYPSAFEKGVLEYSKGSNLSYLTETMYPAFIKSTMSTLYEFVLANTKVTRANGEKRFLAEIAQRECHLSPEGKAYISTLISSHVGLYCIEAVTGNFLSIRDCTRSDGRKIRVQAPHLCDILTQGQTVGLRLCRSIDGTLSCGHGIYLFPKKIALVLRILCKEIAEGTHRQNFIRKVKIEECIRTNYLLSLSFLSDDNAPTPCSFGWLGTYNPLLHLDMYKIIDRNFVLAGLRKMQAIHALGSNTWYYSQCEGEYEDSWKYLERSKYTTNTIAYLQITEDNKLLVVTQKEADADALAMRIYETVASGLSYEATEYLRFRTLFKLYLKRLPSCIAEYVLFENRFSILGLEDTQRTLANPVEDDLFYDEDFCDEDFCCDECAAVTKEPKMFRHK